MLISPSGTSSSGLFTCVMADSVGEMVGENCLEGCLRDSGPMGRLSGESWVRLRGEVLSCCCNWPGKSGGYELKQEPDPPTALPADWRDCPLMDELLREDCKDWLLRDDCKEGEELREDCREGLLSDDCREVELRELGKEWLLKDDWIFGLLSDD